MTTFNMQFSVIIPSQISDMALSIFACADDRTNHGVLAKIDSYMILVFCPKGGMPFPAIAGMAIKKERQMRRRTDMFESDAVAGVLLFMVNIRMIIAV